jgi:hypothetical protein
MKFVSLMKKRKAVIIISGIIGLFLLGDYYVGQKQDSIITERAAKKDQLEKLAYRMIIPDVVDLQYIPDSPGKYDITLQIENLADEPVYATYPQARAYIQSGILWKEVPLEQDTGEQQEQIQKLEKGVHFYKDIVTISRDIEYSYYHMYGYMHLRYYVTMFVMPQSFFEEEEVIERVSEVYLYVKPDYLSDQDILAEVDFADNQVPIFIPMPPH